MILPGGEAQAIVRRPRGPLDFGWVTSILRAISSAGVRVQRSVSFLFAVGVALVLAGCGETMAMLGLGNAGPPSDLPAYRESDAAVVVIDLETIGCCYVEGAIHALEVDGPMEAEWKIAHGSEGRLPPGDYVLTAYEQVCNGNCARLSPPTNHCSLSLELAASATVTVEISYPLMDTCTIFVRSVPSP